MRYFILFSILGLAACALTESGTSPKNPTFPPAFTSSFWPYELEGCRNTKDQFLDRTSQRKVTWDKKNGKDCHVKTGKWFDYLTLEEFTNAKEALVTTVVPLAYAKKNSTTPWTLHKTMAFVHDWDQLIILKKNGQGEQQYLQNEIGLYVVPDESQFRCQLVAQWQDARERWSVVPDGNETAKASEWLKDCGTAEFYNRDLFPHWTKQSKNDCDTRSEALTRDIASIGTLKTKGCQVTGGKWYDPYSNRYVDQPSKVDVDHFVPLANAYYSGAWRWNQVKKENYANYSVDPFHLQSVSQSENRRKGARHPAQYMPSNGKYHCDYLEQWLNVKFRWGLQLNSKEAQSIKDQMTKKCPQLSPLYKSVIELLTNPNLKDVNYPGRE